MLFLKGKWCEKFNNATLLKTISLAPIQGIYKFVLLIYD